MIYKLLSAILVTLLVLDSSAHRRSSGSPTRSPSSSRPRPTAPIRIGVQNARLSEGQVYNGVRNGPDLIRSTGLIQFLNATLGHDVFDYGDIDLNETTTRQLTPIRNPEEVGQATYLISRASERISREGRVVLTLGGDHSVSIGTINGVAAVHPDVAVLYVDAHPDINTPATTGSGNMHGMPLAFVVKELEADIRNLTSFNWTVPRIAARNVGYIGLGWINSGMRDIIERLDIITFGIRDIDREGIVQVTRRALKRITSNFRRPVHVSFDIDVLDDIEIGGNTGTPVEGGLTFREAMTLLEEVQSSVRIVGVDFVEVNPSLGDGKANNRTAALSRSLISCMFGYCRGGLRGL